MEASHCQQYRKNIQISQISCHAIGRTIKKGTLIKSVRTKNKSGLTKMYYGLKWKSLTNSNCSLLDIKTISGSDFFVMFESETKLQDISMGLLLMDTKYELKCHFMKINMLIFWCAARK